LDIEACRTEDTEQKHEAGQLHLCARACAWAKHMKVEGAYVELEVAMWVEAPTSEVFQTKGSCTVRVLHDAV
jgi:hypothetical protein